MKNQIQKINKKDSQLVNLESQLDLLLKGQEKNSDKLQIIGEELRRGFIGLALRNEELLKSNDQQKQQLNVNCLAAAEFKKPTRYLCLREIKVTEISKRKQINFILMLAGLG